MVKAWKEERGNEMNEIKKLRIRMAFFFAALVVLSPIWAPLVLIVGNLCPRHWRRQANAASGYEEE